MRRSGTHPGQELLKTFTVWAGPTRWASVTDHRKDSVTLPADGKRLAVLNSVKVKISVVLPQSHRGGEKLP